MTGNNHRFFAAGICASLGLLIEPLVGFMPAAMLVIASIPGATAPDWLEIRIGNRTLIPHRTITHLLLAWLAMIAVSVPLIITNPLPGALLMGFAIGGFSHWIGDAGTPMGVPIWHPSHRVTFNWWKTGSSEVFPVLAVWLVVALLYFFTQSDQTMNLISEVIQ